MIVFALGSPRLSRNCMLLMVELELEGRAVGSKLGSLGRNK